MPSPIDPTRPWRKRLTITWIIGTAVTISCAAWALRPVPSPDLTTPTINTTARDVPTDTHATANDDINPSVFNVKLWNPPPLPKEPEPLIAREQPPPKPLKLQLIGIIYENGSYQAAVYDPDADRLLILADGDRVADQTITSVTSSTVELTDAPGGTTRTLALKEDHS